MLNKFDLSGLANINIELTSRCNKNCWICGRRKVEREMPELAMKYGDMPFELVSKIAGQLPPNVVVQLHSNGEALLYPEFGKAVALFKKQITNVVTNGKLLLEKSDEVIGNLDTMAISVFEKDPEADEQFKIIEKFFEIKGDAKPYTILRLNGDVDESRYAQFGPVFARRALHSAMGSFKYKKASPTVPEIGICLDFLHHLAVNSLGEVSICVRFDPKRVGVIGNANTQTLDEIWNGEKRMAWLEMHKSGKRDKIPLCSACEFWGVPTGITSKLSE